MEKIRTLFELLCLNDSKEVSKFLIARGKDPKPICPIAFVDKIEFKEKEIENND